ncbi:hypothetical protein Hanom_Chr06g00530121 [Helianthus anomalus]
MGGPSNAVSEVNSTPVAPVPPPMGYENPIPAYTDAAGYNPFEPQNYSGYNYQALAVDPYIEAANFHALYPSPFPPVYPTGYPAYGYQYPPPPQPHQQQPPQPRIQQPQQQEILQRLHEVEQRVEERDRTNKSFLKGLANLIKGIKKKDR